MKTIRAAYYKPGEPMRRVEFPDTLREYQGLVGGYIETSYILRTCPQANELIVVCNEEGILKGLEENRLGIAGPFVVVGDDGEDFRSLSDEEFEFLEERIR